MAIIRLSILDDEDKAALAAHVLRMFNEKGRMIFNCDKCRDDIKRVMGCGYVEDYKGLWNPKYYDSEENENEIFKGICPGFYHNSRFFDSFMRLDKFRSQLGDPRKLPNRYVEAVIQFDYYKSYRDRKEREERERKNGN